MRGARALLALAACLAALVLLRDAHAACGTRPTYRVQPGDTLSGIAARSGTTVRELVRANKLDPKA
ncbi:MAG TPA: LysM domain-containing protein, partial [Stellaceae bacterium]|nr:LysM domain-containing protein [Stellaceae bacterium]